MPDTGRFHVKAPHLNGAEPVNHLDQIAGDILNLRTILALVDHTLTLIERFETRAPEGRVMHERVGAVSNSLRRSVDMLFGCV